jgi:hypothetical protein
MAPAAQSHAAASAVPGAGEAPVPSAVPGAAGEVAAEGGEAPGDAHEAAG